MQPASLAALLQAAVSLLTLVQSTPNIPQSLENTAVQTAEQAISLASAQLLATQGNSSAVISSHQSNSLAADLSASPLSGPAPLAVNFSANVPTITNNGSYWIDFGDGTLRQGFCAQHPDAAVTCTFAYPGSTTISHTYQIPGTYTALLVRTAANQEVNVQTLSTQGVTVGTAQVSVE